MNTVSSDPAPLQYLAVCDCAIFVHCDIFYNYSKFSNGIICATYIVNL